MMRRSGPNYAEDTDHVLSTILGLDTQRIAELKASGAVADR